MKKNKKRIVSILLAASMSMALVPTAFAESNSTIETKAPDYFFTVGNTTKSFYAESLEALTVQEGKDYSDPANEPSTNYINTKFYLDVKDSKNAEIGSKIDSLYPGVLSWAVPEAGSFTVSLDTDYSSGIPDSKGATFSSSLMYRMYGNQYIVGYPFADLVVSSEKGGDVTVALEYVSAAGAATVIAKGTANIKSGSSSAAVHIDLKQACENRSSDYVAYNLADGSMRVVLYGKNVTVTFASGANGSTVTIPFVDNTENVLNGAVTIDGKTYNGTMYRFRSRTYINYTKNTQNDSWISFPTGTRYTVGADNAAEFKGLEKTIKFLVQGNMVRNGEVQSYTGNAKNTLPFPNFYYLDTVKITPAADLLYMPGYKILRGVIYTPTAAAPNGGYPAILYIHGYNGQYSAIGTYLTAMLAKGYAVVGIDLRNYPSNVSPDHYTDIKGNIRYIRANAAKYGLNPDTLAVFGQSLGGNSALMAAVSSDDPDIEGKVGGNIGVSSRVQASVVGYGWSDLINFGLDQREDQEGDPASKIANMLSGGDGETAPAAEVIDWYGPGKGLLMLRNFISQYKDYKDGINGSLSDLNGQAYTFSTGADGRLDYTFIVDDAYIGKWFAVLGPNAYGGGSTVITKGTYTYTADELFAAIERAYAASPLYHINAASSNIMAFAGFGGGQNITNNQTTRTMKAYSDVDATAFEAANTQAGVSAYAYGSMEEVCASIDAYLDTYLKNKPEDTKIALYAADSKTRKYNVAANYVSSSSDVQPVIERDGAAWISLELLRSLIGSTVPAYEVPGQTMTVNGHIYGTVKYVTSITGLAVKYYPAGKKGSYIPWYDSNGKVLPEHGRLAGSYGIVTVSYANGNLLAKTMISTPPKNTVQESKTIRDTSYYTAAEGWNNQGVLINNTNSSAPKYYYNVPDLKGAASWRYSNTFPTEEENYSKLYLDDLDSIAEGGSGNSGTLNPALPDTAASMSGKSLSFSSAPNMSTSGSNLELVGFAQAYLWVTGAAGTKANLAVSIELGSKTGSSAIVSKNLSVDMTGNPVNVKVDFTDAITKSYAAGTYFKLNVSSDTEITIGTGGDSPSCIVLPTTEKNSNVYNGTVTLASGAQYAGTMYFFSDAKHLYYNGTWIKLPVDGYTVRYETISGGTVISKATFDDAGIVFEPEAIQFNGRAQDYTGGMARGGVAFPSFNRVQMTRIGIQPLTDGLYLPTMKSLNINIYLPNEAKSGAVPLVIFVHGYGGDISGIDSFLMACLANGYAVAGVDLRAYPPECTPDWYADISGNVRFLRANADKYNLNSEKFALYGQSLGGNSSLGAAVGAYSSIEGGVGGNTGISSRVQAAVIGYGWTDLINFGLDQRTDNAGRTDLLASMISGGDGENAPAASAINWYGAGKGFLMLRNFMEQYELYKKGINGSLANTEGRAYHFCENSEGELCYTFTIDSAYRERWFPFGTTDGLFAAGTVTTLGTYTYTVAEILAAIQRAAETSPISYVSPDDPVMALYGGFGGAQNITNNQSMRTFKELQNNGVLTFYYGNTQGNYGKTAVVKAGLLNYLDKWLKGNPKGTKIVLTPGSDTAVVNYVDRRIKTPLILDEKGTPYIPVSYVARVIGADVSGITASIAGVVEKNGALYTTAKNLSSIPAFKALTATWYAEDQTMVIFGNVDAANTNPDK